MYRPTKTWKEFVYISITSLSLFTIKSYMNLMLLCKFYTSSSFDYSSALDRDINILFTYKG